MIEFVYSMFKASQEGFLHRWQGSSGNPQLWAVQASLFLLIWLLARQHLKQRWLLTLSLTMIIAAIILSASISNWIGLLFAALTLPFGFWALLIFLIYFLWVHIFIWKFLCGFHGSMAELKILFQGLAHKFVPRIKLWLDLLKASPSLDLDYISGLGLEKYREFMRLATHGKHQNVHNLYLHNYLLNGIAGIYLSSFAFWHYPRSMLQNKYFLAIGIYVLSSAVFDCATMFIEVQMLFYLFLPVLLDRND